MSVDLELDQERTDARGFTWRARLYDHGSCLECQLRLSFQDHEWWCHGRLPAHRVAAAALQVGLNSVMFEALPDPVDCAWLRHRVDGFDESLKRVLAEA